MSDDVVEGTLDSDLQDIPIPDVEKVESTILDDDPAPEPKTKPKKPKAPPKKPKAPPKAQAKAATKAKATAKGPAPKAATQPAPSVDEAAARIRTAVRLLKHIADPTRINIIISLNEGQSTYTEICAALSTEMTISAVSHHLALLRTANLVEPTREGRFVTYTLTESGQKLAEMVAPMIRS